MVRSSRLTNLQQIFYFLINGKMHNLNRQTGGLRSIQFDLNKEGGMKGMHAYQLGTWEPTVHLLENRRKRNNLTRVTSPWKSAS
jgi:hypothetical protein